MGHDKPAVRFIGGKISNVYIYARMHISEHKQKKNRKIENRECGKVYVAKVEANKFFPVLTSKERTKKQQRR